MIDAANSGNSRSPRISNDALVGRRLRPGVTNFELLCEINEHMPDASEIGEGAICARRGWASIRSALNAAEIHSLILALVVGKFHRHCPAQQPKK
jgi:hypothetical protein